MTHPLVTKLNALQILDFEEFVGKTVLEVLDRHGLYVAFESGEWALISYDREAGGDVYLACTGVDHYDLRNLHEMGVVSNDEMAEWNESIAQADAARKVDARNRKLKDLQELLSEFPEEAREYLKAPAL